MLKRLHHDEKLTIMKYRFLNLVWLLPSYLAFIMVQQANVYRGTIHTYNNGESIAADVIDFDIKQIAAQSNGYVVLEFIDPDGDVQERKLSLSVQMAHQIMNTPVIPIRYQENTFQEIVMIPTYELQKGMALSNLGVAFIGFAVLVTVSIFVTRFANKKAVQGSPDLTVERVDI